MKRTSLVGFLICLFAIGGIAGARILHTTYLASWNEHQLEDLTSRAVTRAELAVDLAVITLGDLWAEGNLACGEKELGRLRKTIYATAAMKDVVVSSAGTTCQGFKEAGTALELAMKFAPRHASRNSNINLFEVKNGNGNNVGIGWRLEEGVEVAAMVSLDNVVFDILPMPLRDASEIKLSLNGAAPIAHYRAEKTLPDGERDDLRLYARSDRYPLIAVLSVDRQAVNTWNKENSLYIDLPAAFVAALVGALLSQILFRPVTPAANLAKALRNGEIRPYFQPIIALGSNEIVGCELLARWIKRDGCMVSPAQFIPLAETTGLIDDVLEAVLTDAGQQLAGVLEQRPNLKVAVNVTPEQFIGAAFVTRLCNLVHQSGLSRARLVVEVTERQAIADMHRAREVTVELREHGILVAIDDAGTGHNGLSSMQTLGASCVKIDKLFVDAVATDHRTRTLVEMLVGVSREFGMTTVAEGIEHPEQIAVLKALGVQEGQGFLIAKPMPAEAFVRLIGKSNQAGKVVPLEAMRPMPGSASTRSQPSELRMPC